MDVAPTRLHVGNLPPSTTAEELRRAFQDAGRRVRDVHLPVDERTGRPRGFALVDMESADEALRAIEALDGRQLEGRPLHLETAPTPRRTRFVGERWEK